MLKRDYLSRLSRAARWRLGAKEAEEVISDYRELLTEDTRRSEELVRDLGRPLDAVKPLTDQKAYRLWLAVFAVLAAGLAMVGWCAVVSWSPVVWDDLFGETHYARVMALLVLSAAVTLAWFRLKGSKSDKLPRAVPVLLVVLLVWLALVLGASWAWLHDPLGFAEMWGKMPVLRGPLAGQGMMSVSRFILLEALEWIGGAGMAVTGIIALVKARTGDRRWAAVYILAVTAVLVSLEQLTLMTARSMYLTESGWAGVSAFFYSWVKLVAVGLIGTGAALC